MNRAEFMRRLTELLSDVPPAERDEAIQYYNDYFEDAGAENESSVIASLGTPEELARAIKAGLNDGGAGGEFTETGFSGYAQTHKDEIMKAGAEAGGGAGKAASGNPYGAQPGASGNAYYQDDYYRRTGGRGIYGGRKDGRQNNDPYSQQTMGGAAAGNAGGSEQASQGAAAQPRKRGISGGTIALIVVVVILTFPIWVGVVGALFGVAVALLATVFALFLAFLAVGLALIVAAVALFVTGCMLLVHAPLAGVSTIGVSLVLFGLGLLAVWLMVWGMVALFKGCAALIRKIFHRGGARA